MFPQRRLKEHFGQWKALNERYKQSWVKLSKVTQNTPQKEKEKIDNEYSKSYFNLFSITHIYNRFESIIKDVELVQSTKEGELNTFKEYEKQINSFLKIRRLGCRKMVTLS